MKESPSPQCVPAPGEPFDIVVHTRNIGGELPGVFSADVYIDWVPSSDTDYGDYFSMVPALEPGERYAVALATAGMIENTYAVARILILRTWW